MTDKNPISKMSTQASIDGKEITDSLGRKIVLRKAGIMDKYQLYKALGADSSIPMCAGMMMATIYVAAIDGSPVPTPRTQFEAEAALNRLGDEGFNAVNKEVGDFLEEQEKSQKDNVKK